MNILLFRGRGLISALIRWQTRGHYSHAAIVDDDGRVIEAWQGAGVRLLTRLKRGTVGVDCFCVRGMTLEQDAAMRTWLAQQLGLGYDYLGVMRFVSRGRRNNPRTWFCSELVYAAFQQVGINLFRDTEAWEVSPDMLSRSPLLDYACI